MKRDWRAQQTPVPGLDPGLPLSYAPGQRPDALKTQLLCSWVFIVLRYRQAAETVIGRHPSRQNAACGCGVSRKG